MPAAHLSLVDQHPVSANHSTIKMFRKLALSVGRSLHQSGLSLGHKSCLTQEPFFTNRIGRGISVSSCRRDLMEFFDDKKNWGESSVRSGRSWKVEELRIKSNTDLHKLWYILLKEKNMLLTMEHEAKKEYEYFPNPERIDKVDESMKNLEEVVRERNRAYYLLETGETGERPGAEVENFLGLPEYQQHEEHAVPKDLNKPYLKAKSEEPVVDPDEKKWFLTRYRAKQRRLKRQELKRQQYEVIQIMKRFPSVDIEALKEKYPDVDMEKYVERFINGKHLGNLAPKKCYTLRREQM